MGGRWQGGSSWQRWGGCPIAAHRDHSLMSPSPMIGRGSWCWWPGLLVALSPGIHTVTNQYPSWFDLRYCQDVKLQQTNNSNGILLFRTMKSLCELLVIYITLMYHVFIPIHDVATIWGVAVGWKPMMLWSGRKWRPGQLIAPVGEILFWSLLAWKMCGVEGTGWLVAELSPHLSDRWIDRRVNLFPFWGRQVGELCTGSLREFLSSCLSLLITRSCKQKQQGLFGLVSG